jgi:hypothetical protein
MRKNIRKVINFIYRQLMNFKPIQDLEGLSDVEIIGWVSDFTHLREQLPVFEALSTKHRIAFITNKNDLKEYIINHTNFKVGTLKFRNNNIAQVEIILKKHIPKIKYALVGNDLRAVDATVGKALHKLKTPYGVITHGINYLNFHLNDSIADNLFVWTHEEKNRMMKQGVPSEKICISGSPYFSQLMKNDGYVELTDQISPAINSNKTKLLIAISGAGNLYSKIEHFETIESLNESAIELEESHIFITKLHRKDNLEFYENKFGLHIINENTLTSCISKIVPILRKSNIVITGASTTVIEAMLLQKPVIIFDKNPKTKLLPFVTNQTVLFCNNIDMLKRHILNLNESVYLKECIDKQNTFINEHFNVTINPTKTIAQEIIKHLNNIKSSLN